MLSREWLGHHGMVWVSVIGWQGPLRRLGVYGSYTRGYEWWSLSLSLIWIRTTVRSLSLSVSRQRAFTLNVEWRWALHHGQDRFIVIWGTRSHSGQSNSKERKHTRRIQIEMIGIPTAVSIRLLVSTARLKTWPKLSLVRNFNCTVSHNFASKIDEIVFKRKI